ncbi:MAG: hypothetical protein AAGB31_01955 [Bdellovibrio sp.]
MFPRIAFAILMFLLPLSTWARVRTVEVKKDQIVTVRTALGVATIIQVPDRPNSLVVGDQSAFASDKTAMFRVVISKESNERLESAVSRCAEGFDAGEFTKSDIANYIFQNLGKFFSESDVKALRAAHFDEKKMLGSILSS